jgi:hypothetical protein
VSGAGYLGQTWSKVSPIPDIFSQKVSHISDAVYGTKAMIYDDV